MTAAVFVDANVLVYYHDKADPEKQAGAQAWFSYLWQTRSGRLSFQVVQEFYSAATKKLRPGMELERARRWIRSLLAWDPVVVDARGIEGAWGIQERYGLSWWDALIVSAAQISGCRYLLTEDLQENQRFGDVRVIHPFRTSPADLGLAQPRLH